MARLIKRGQIWIADLNPGYGIEIHKKRPVLIISSDIFNMQLRTAIVVPLSTQVIPLGPEKILIEKNGTGLDQDSAALCIDIRAIDKNRLLKLSGKIPQIKIKEIEEALKLVLGLIQE